MMYEILGIEPVDYESKKTGKRVTGTRLHCINGTPSDRVKGQRVDNFYVPARIDCDSFNIGDRIEVYYNRFGGVDSIQLAD